ncbi:unnamed protein product [Schistosoma margrebowiei]|uniref:Uncharacterized protein n=1 Tax=Schistosoma margrebowiei TaxID=48269 RepID=A0A3P8A788_9TREM|nr:unnamed protein product [Schistosoma margrebowiei]
MQFQHGNGVLTMMTAVFVGTLLKHVVQIVNSQVTIVLLFGVNVIIVSICIAL